MSTLARIEHYSVVLMTVVFVLLFAATYWPARKSKLEEHGRIPLKDDE